MSLVLGAGPKKCDVCFIGEAPGATEARVGRPFVGKSGQLFDSLLSKAGILRSRCYVTNVIKEQPPGNQLKYFIHFKTKNVEVTEAARDYIELLHQELAEVESNLFVPMGEAALWVLTGQRKVVKRRGSIMLGTGRYEGQKIIPIRHPSAALRDNTLAYILKHDFKRIVQEMQTPTLSLPKRNYITRPKRDEIFDHLSELKKHPGPIYSDIEVEMNSKQLSCIGYGVDNESAICIPLMYEQGNYLTPEDEGEVLKRVSQIQANPDVQKIGQNYCFDTSFLLHRHGIRTHNFDCTMIAQALVAPDLPKGLDFLCSIYTREPYYKDEGKEAMFRGIADFKQYWEYNCKDVVVLAEIWDILLAQMKHFGIYSLYERYKRMLPCILYMQERGILMDKQGLIDHSKKLTGELDDLRQKAEMVYGGPLPDKFLTSPKQLMNYFYNVKGFSAYSKGGKPTIDDEALKKLDIKGDMLAKIIRVHRRLSKLKSTYIDVSVDEDSRLRYSINPVGTKNHRFSSSSNIFGVGTNLQNIPPAASRYLKADPGYLVFEPDLSQADDRIVAFTGPESTKRKGYLDGLDPHKLTAGLIFNMDPEDVSDEPGSSDLGNGEHSQRYWGKRCNHALNYGLGPVKFAAAVEITVALAKRLVEKYHYVYPDVRRNFQHNIIQQLKENRIVLDCFGNPRRFLDFWGDELFRTAFAYPAQSTVAWQINEYGLLYIYENPDLFKPVECQGQVHDSIRFQIPVKVGWEEMATMLKLIKASMETPIPYKDPFVIPAEIKAGLSYGKKDMHELTCDDTLPEQLERLYVENTAA